MGGSNTGGSTQSQVMGILIRTAGPSLALLAVASVALLVTKILLRLKGVRRLDASYIESEEKLGWIVIVHCIGQILLLASVVWFEISSFGVLLSLKEAGSQVRASAAMQGAMFFLGAIIILAIIPWVALIFWELFRPKFLKNVLVFALRIVRLLQLIAIPLILIMAVVGI